MKTEYHCNYPIGLTGTLAEYTDANPQSEDYGEFIDNCPICGAELAIVPLSEQPGTHQYDISVLAKHLSEKENALQEKLDELLPLKEEVEDIVARIKELVLQKGESYKDDYIAATYRRPSQRQSVPKANLKPLVKEFPGANKFIRVTDVKESVSIKVK